MFLCTRHRGQQAQIADSKILGKIFFNMKIIECLLCPKYVVMRFLQSDESEGKLETDKSKTKQRRYTGRVLGPGKIKDCSRKKK